jgi:hypothetical protein
MDAKFKMIQKLSTIIQKYFEGSIRKITIYHLYFTKSNLHFTNNNHHFTNT